MRGRDCERGSVLALVPAAFLVMVILAAIAVDSAVTFMGQRQLHDALAGAANDAAGAALSNSAFYRSGAVELDPSLAARVACASLAAEHLGLLRGLTVDIGVDARTVTLRGAAEVDAVFGRALPGFGRRRVEAAAGADLSGGEESGQPSIPLSLQPLDCGPLSG